MFRSEIHAWIHAVFAVLVIGAGFYFGLEPLEWGMVILAIAMVLSAEAFNTSLEALTDLASPEHHELARKTKDTAAGAVLLLAMGAVVIGLIIFLPKFLLLLK